VESRRGIGWLQNHEAGSDLHIGTRPHQSRHLERNHRRDRPLGFQTGHLACRRTTLARMADTGIVEEVRALIERGGESADLDYKAPIAWPPIASAERHRLVKTMMAMSNLEDGGRILLGINDKSKAPVGLSADEAQTWDTTSVAAALAHCASPAPHIHVHQANVDGLLLVLVRVSPVAPGPTICQNVPGHAAAASELRRGAVYVRRPGAETVEVSTEQEMRELLRIVMRREEDRILREFQRLLDRATGAAAPPETHVDLTAGLDASVTADLAWMREDLP